ncbi:MAG: diguanylate cyclase (GGDEF)-like protein [Candidatus Aldehydirespiratoraceae bacterium]|jgi:diguanylate cyclase (GGDEF)-like protein
MLSRVRSWSGLAATPALLFALLGLILLSSPVRAAQAPPPEGGPFPQIAGSVLSADVRDDVLELLFLEIALLERLDAFAASPQRIGEIHDAYDSWPDVDRAVVVGFVLETDARLDELHRSITDNTGSPSQSDAPLMLLSPAERNRIVNEVPGAIQVLPYMLALNELVGPDPAAPGGPADDSGAPAIDNLTALLDRIVDPGELDRLNTENGALRARADQLQTGSAGTSWSVVLLIATAALFVGALIAAAWLRRRAALSDPVGAEVLEAHRRLAGALDQSEVAIIGCRTAVDITDATDAFIFRRVDDGLRRIGGTNVIAHSVLTRVVETAQPLLLIVGDDPAVSTASICVVPLVAEGRVDGVLVARRATDQPFDNESRRRLELLGPALASALSGADQLDSFENLAMVDGLTALGNRRRLDRDLETALSQATERQLPVGFAMIDVDSFKTYNDSHGHEAGDRALQAVARIIESTVRAGDVVYRYGGEEFSMLLPGATRQEAQAAGERIRAAVERAPFEGEDSQPGGHLTVSVGVATLEGGTAETLKARADDALYGAKALGRNRIVVD